MIFQSFFWLCSWSFFLFSFPVFQAQTPIQNSTFSPAARLLFSKLVTLLLSLSFQKRFGRCWQDVCACLVKWLKWVMRRKNEETKKKERESFSSAMQEYMEVIPKGVLTSGRLVGCVSRVFDRWEGNAEREKRGTGKPWRTWTSPLMTVTISSSNARGAKLTDRIAQ